MKNGNKFIVIEGIDGSGKTTVSKYICNIIDAQFYKTPSFPFSDIRKLIDENVNLKSRFFFYLSSVIHASHEIRELLKTRTVVCDRYILSTLCYHRAADPFLKSFNETKVEILEPDLTFYLDANCNVRMKRITKRENVDFKDLFNSDLHVEEFQDKVESEFRKYKNLIWVNTNILSAEDVADQLIEKIIDFEV